MVAFLSCKVFNLYILSVILGLTTLTLGAFVSDSDPDTDISPSATVDVELVPRGPQTGIPAVQCVLDNPLVPVQCCQEIEPLVVVFDLLEPIFEALGIPLPPLDTIIALDCQPTLLGLACANSVLCCSSVIPNENIGVGCQPVGSLLKS